jgi:hypothetical protein
LAIGDDGDIRMRPKHVVGPLQPIVDGVRPLDVRDAHLNATLAAVELSVAIPPTRRGKGNAAPAGCEKSSIILDGSQF